MKNLEKSAANVANIPQTAKEKAAIRVHNGENVIRFWDLDGAFFVKSSMEATNLAKVLEAPTSRVWSFSEDSLSKVLHALVSKEFFVYIF